MLKSCMIREEHITSTNSNEHTHNWNASDTLQEKKRKLVYNILVTKGLILIVSLRLSQEPQRQNKSGQKD